MKMRIKPQMSKYFPGPKIHAPVWASETLVALTSQLIGNICLSQGQMTPFIS